jgi:hypothetical protein
MKVNRPPLKSTIATVLLVACATVPDVARSDEVEGTGLTQNLACNVAQAKATATLPPGAAIGECRCTDSGSGISRWKCRVSRPGPGAASPGRPGTGNGSVPPTPAVSTAPRGTAIDDDTPGDDAPLGIDVLAPEGVSVGMPFGTATAKLQAGGFVRHGRCAFVLRNAGMSKQKMVRIGRIDQGSQEQCTGSGRVTWLSARYTLENVGGSDTMIDLIKDAERRLGAAPKCRLTSERELNGCIFQSPPAAPDLQQVKLRGGLGGGVDNRALDLTLELVGKP